MNLTEQKGGLTIGMEHRTIRTARDGVDELDILRRERGQSQLQISLLAGTPDVGQQYARMYKSGDVMLSKYLRFLRAVGYEMVIVEKEGLDEQST